MSLNNQREVNYMAKTNKNLKDNQLETLLKKNEFWIGLGVVAVVAGVAGGLLFGGNQKGNIADSGAVAPTLTPVIKSQPTAFIAKKTPSNNLKKITKLADTAGSYIVLEGDNYWKISKKVCGTGKYFLSIRAQNNAQDLHAGDQLVAECVK